MEPELCLQRKHLRERRTEEGQNAERLLPNVAERVRIWKIRGTKNKYHKRWIRKLKDGQDFRKNNVFCIWFYSFLSFLSSTYFKQYCQLSFPAFASCLKLQLLPVCNLLLHSRHVVPKFSLFSAFLSPCIPPLIYSQPIFLLTPNLSFFYSFQSSSAYWPPLSTHVYFTEYFASFLFGNDCISLNILKTFLLSLEHGASFQGWCIT